MVRMSQCILMLTVFFHLQACGQRNQSGNSIYSDLFVGSTACNGIIKSWLGIPDSTGCEFMRWELHCQSIDKDSGQFQVNINYGMSRPNTNGFMNDGFHISAKGQFSNRISPGTNQQARIIKLYWEGLKAPLRLIVMDANVLHFVDERNHFLPGNGGWGLALYRPK
jgi:hypothetical protein